MLPDASGELLGLEESSRVVARHHWVESNLFVLLGGWVQTTSTPDAKLLFDRQAGHHAWRAQQWWNRLPALADVDRAAMVALPGDHLAAVFKALSDEASTVSRLVCTYRVLIPRLAVSYERHRASVSAVADSSVLRTLEILARDVSSDWLDGEAVLERVLGSGMPSVSGFDGEALSAANSLAASLEVQLASAAGF